MTKTRVRVENNITTAKPFRPFLTTTVSSNCQKVSKSKKVMTMTDIVTHLRRWGLRVETVSGYKTRGRPFTFKPKGVLCHHTASGELSGNFGSERIVTHGRSD